jgi:ABC-2 type transport system permease protein
MLCVLAPFLVLAAFKVQGAVPQDTLFGQWVHTSGFAVSLVILGFSGQWALPVLGAVVAGDIFSAEDHLGTWKTILTLSRGRGQIFVGKVAAALTYVVLTLVLLAGCSTLAGLGEGTQPTVGLSGQVVAPGHAFGLALASWATQLPPVLAFSSLAILLSIVARNSVVGIGVPVLAGLVMQLLTLVDLPGAVQAALLNTPLASWHGFWVQPAYYGPLREGLVTSAAWFIACLDIAWVVFRFRSIRAS